MQLAKKGGQVFAPARFEQQMVVIIQDDPGTQGKVPSQNEGFERIAHKRFGRFTGKERGVIERGRSDDVPGVIKVNVRWMMVRHVPFLSSSG